VAETIRILPRTSIIRPGRAAREYGHFECMKNSGMRLRVAIRRAGLWQVCASPCLPMREGEPRGAHIPTKGVGTYAPAAIGGVSRRGSRRASPVPSAATIGAIWVVLEKTGRQRRGLP
jgi:hypothetical protein